MDLHVDPLGGWSGDMFAAAVLDAFPEFWTPVCDSIALLDLGPGAACQLVEHRDHALTGRRFLVAVEAGLAGGTLPHGPGHDHAGHDHHDHHHHDHDHDESHGQAGHPAAEAHTHRSWASIRALLSGSRLDAPVIRHAVAIFGLLAEAEAQVHGVAEDDVTFHEVGAIDSIVDIVAAAQLIVLLDAELWTSAPLPLGSGRVRTAHGVLPVPAPATALLLRGLPTIDDGIPGERVTPTGAAIARHLLAETQPLPGRVRRLQRTGTGFGTRVLPGISNCLRILAFETVEAGTVARDGFCFAHRELGVVEFEVDDQSAEDLSNGLEHVRALPGVHDVVQSLAFGKKGRMATHVQVLVAPSNLTEAIAACFQETTTIGLRYHTVNGAALDRSFATVGLDGRSLRVKTVERPGGSRTAKTEASDVAAERGHAERVRLRRAAEAAVLRGETAEGSDDER